MSDDLNMPSTSPHSGAEGESLLNEPVAASRQKVYTPARLTEQDGHLHTVRAELCKAETALRSLKALRLQFTPEMERAQQAEEERLARRKKHTGRKQWAKYMRKLKALRDREKSAALGVVLRIMPDLGNLTATSVDDVMEWYRVEVARLNKLWKKCEKRTKKMKLRTKVALGMTTTRLHAGSLLRLTSSLGA